MSSELTKNYKKPQKTIHKQKKKKKEKKKKNIIKMTRHPLNI